ncbi:MAG: DEAD/DEAH box helicase [Maricaulaceae bacterium]
MTTFSDLKLAAPVASALEKIGYQTPTPIQAQAIPSILEGRDIQGIAQTGTGKTAAFTLPVLSRLCDDPKEAPKRSMRVLILSPTRELARQIGESVTDYARHIEGFRSTVVFGGVSLRQQIKKVVPGNDIVVATPGRLLDLMGQKLINLKSVEYLVLDEADQMMDMGFIHALRKMIPHLPKERQTLFFSATMPKSIAQLASKFLTNPVKVSVTPESTTAERVEQSVVFAKRQEKHDLLCIKLLDPTVNRALVFTRTKHGADRVVKRLASVGLKSVAIHGNKSQGQRTRALTAFKDGSVKFLIATDVAARGIDIRGVSHVFNFEIPNVPEQYVHRIGRTGRAGEAGIAVAFVADDEKNYLRDIQKMLKTSIQVDPLPTNFREQVKALKSRPALTKEEMQVGDVPQQQPRARKGRKSRPAFGEGKKKSKTSTHRKGPTAQPKSRDQDRNRDNDDNAAAVTGAGAGFQHKKKDASGKPSRAERKRSKAVEHDGADNRKGKKKPYNHKPRRASGERSDNNDTQNSAKPKSGNFKRKPRREDDRSTGERSSGAGRNDNRGFKGRKDGNRDENRNDRPRRDNGSNESKPKSRSNTDNRENRNRDNKRSDKPSGQQGGGQQGGYGSPKRRSSRTDGGRPPSKGGSKGPRAKSGDKSKFKRKPNGNSRPKN